MSNIQQGISKGEVGGRPDERRQSIRATSEFGLPCWELDILSLGASSLNARNENGDQLVTLVDRAGEVRQRNQGLLPDHLEPDERFPQFLETDFEFMDKILRGFGTLRLAVVRSR